MVTNKHSRCKLETIHKIAPINVICIDDGAKWEGVEDKDWLKKGNPYVVHGFTYRDGQPNLAAVMVNGIEMTFHPGRFATMESCFKYLKKQSYAK